MSHSTDDNMTPAGDTELNAGAEGVPDPMSGPDPDPPAFEVEELTRDGGVVEPHSTSHAPAPPPVEERVAIHKAPASPAKKKAKPEPAPVPTPEPAPATTPEPAPAPQPAAAVATVVPFDDDDEKIELVWYVLKVQSSREDTIRDALERRVKIQGLQRYFGRIVVPTEKTTEIRNNKKRIVERKTYPGYIRWRWS